MLFNHAQLRFQHISTDELVYRAKEDLLAFAYIKAEPTVLIDNWHKFAFNGYSSLGGQALEVVISGSADLNGAISTLLNQFYTQKIESKTDRVRLFYPALSYAFAELKRRNSDVGMVKQIQSALRILNDGISKPLDEILNPEWVDSYTFEIDEFEFANAKPKDVRKKFKIIIGREKKQYVWTCTHKQMDYKSKFRLALYRAFEEPILHMPSDEPYIPMMEFDDEEFVEEEEDFGLAGDGLHPVVTFHYAEMQNDYMLTGSDREMIKKRAENFMKFILGYRSIYDPKFFDLFTAEINNYELPHHKYAFFVFVEGYLPDGFVPDRYMNTIEVQLPIGKTTLREFHETFGDDILESIIKDHTPVWTEMDIKEIDRYCEETLELQAMAYSDIPVKVAKNKRIPYSYAYLKGYLRSCINGSRPSDWDNAGWSNYRISVSPEGHAAYQKAIAQGGTFRDAMKSFWMAYNNTIISYSTNGLRLRSEKIDWRRAFYKAQAKEIPQSQTKKLFGVVKKLLSTNPNDIWLKKLASLSC